ncbi:E3 ubiquitin-protein ligase MARCH2-like isoform X1 [Centruroides sculpturatus]|uniref:E3 ubiquitin-protein ligase MARCH2-like isoform X1 n=1 Tax=Centruroides sculpturatus TaxID=218467 RepID=UPI000C6DD41A|nr:E3 ubiquitin-protein ligase MARCH2-like isoform X1 [Centruroides sculpturatus]
MTENNILPETSDQFKGNMNDSRKYINSIDSIIGALVTTIKFTSPRNSDVRKCRICFSNEEPLISLCHCRGSVGLVHRKCLEKWLETGKIDTCELCRKNFNIIRIPKNFSDWWKNSENVEEKRNLKVDAFVICILSPMAFLSLILCLQLITENIQRKLWVEAAVISTFCCFLMFAFTFHVVLTVKSHLIIYQKWKENHWTIKILDQSISTMESSASFPDCNRTNSSRLLIANDQQRRASFDVCLQRNGQFVENFQVHYI